MARRFRRKFRGRKFRKRSFRRRSYRRGNRSGRRANRIVSIKRTQLYQYYRNSGAPYLIQGTQSFRLADLPNYGEFQVVFQYYRIKWIKLEFVPNMSPEIQYATAVNGPTSSWGATDILYAKRHADGNQRDFNELLQIQSSKRRKVSQRFTTWLKPAVAQGVYNTTTSWGYAPKLSPWINGDYTSVPHYGITFQSNPSENSNQLIPTNYILNCYATYYVDFKGIR